MADIILFVVLLVLIFINVPIAIALAMSATVFFVIQSEMPIVAIFQRMFNSIDSFPLLAVPFFLLAGKLMESGGISRRLIHLAEVMLGRVRGGLALVSIISCAFFAALSGSAAATTAAVGAIMIPAMVKKGYDKNFSTAIQAAGGTIGVIIPPSVPLVLFGVTASVSISDLFLAGVIPGIFVTGALLILVYVISILQGYGGGEKYNVKEFFIALKDSILALMMPVIILGGLGILVIFVALLPQLAIAGRQLFFAEVSAESKDKLSPRIKDTAGQLLAWYSFLTILCTVGLVFSGLDLATAATNAFSTIAAAGFSSQDSSIAGFHSPAVEWVIIIFMYLAGANFILQVRAASSFLDYLKFRSIESKREKSKNLVIRSLKGLLTNTELMAYTAIIAVASVAICFILAYHMPADTSIADIIRQSLFQCISIITSTGCASVDYEYWPMAAKSVLIILMFIGGCSGSAGGGMKVIRVVILVKYFWKMLLKNIYPEAVIRIKLDNRTIRENDVQPILTFFMCYMALFLIGGTLLCTIENSLIEGYSGAIACLGNTGPGFNAIGPMGNFGHWHALSKLIAIILMWAGRLEVMALVIFFRPEPWRSSRW